MSGVVRAARAVAEELVADIQTKASLAIMEVKTAALEEIRQMKQATDSVQTKSKEEVKNHLEFLMLKIFICDTH